MLATLGGILALIVGLALLLLPVVVSELSRPRDSVWGAVVLLLGLVLVTSADRLTGAPMLAVLCGGLLIGRLGSEVGQGRWRQLSSEEQTALGSSERWITSLNQLVTIAAQLLAALLDTLAKLQQAVQQRRQPKGTGKRWIRQESPAEAGPEGKADEVAPVAAVINEQAESDAPAEAAADSEALDQKPSSAQQDDEAQAQPADTTAADPSTADTAPADLSERAAPEEASEPAAATATDDATGAETEPAESLAQPGAGDKADATDLEPFAEPAVDVVDGASSTPINAEDSDESNGADGATAPDATLDADQGEEADPNGETVTAPLSADNGAGGDNDAEPWPGSTATASPITPAIPDTTAIPVTTAVAETTAESETAVEPETPASPAAAAEPLQVIQSFEEIDALLDLPPRPASNQESQDALPVNRGPSRPEEIVDVEVEEVPADHPDRR